MKLAHKTLSQAHSRARVVGNDALQDYSVDVFMFHRSDILSRLHFFIAFVLEAWVLSRIPIVLGSSFPG